MYSTHTTELVQHYTHFQGPVSNVLEFANGPQAAPRPILVLEFAPPSPEYDWLYITAGMGHKPVPQGRWDHHIELLMYTRQQQEELATSLAQLAMYPYVHNSFFDVGHTIAGEAGAGVVTGSPLTDILLTYVYAEAEGFDTINHSDGTHTQILWATPIYPSERVYAKQRGWKNLIETVFIEQEVQPADLWRPPAV